MQLSFPVAERTSARGRRRPLLWFVLGSLLLHALLVVLWRGEPPAGPVGRSTFQITLLARHGDTPQKPAAEQQQAGESQLRRSDKSSVGSGAQPKSVEDNKTQVPSVTARRAVRNADKTQHTQRRPPGRAHEAVHAATQAVAVGATSDFAASVPGSMNAASGSTSHGQHELTSTARYLRVRDELLQALWPHFDYPPLARRRGWQGRVRIGLLIRADGDLSGVHLIESSGYALLDKAAIKNVTQLGNVPAASRWLNGRDLDVILPVTYRLE